MSYYEVEKSVGDLVEELELRFPEKVAEFERNHPEAMAAVADEDLAAASEEELDDLRDDLVALIEV